MTGLPFRPHLNAPLQTFRAANVDMFESSISQPHHGCKCKHKVNECEHLKCSLSESILSCSPQVFHTFLYFPLQNKFSTCQFFTSVKPVPKFLGGNVSSSFSLSDKYNIMSDGIKSTQIGLEHSASHVSKYLLSFRQWKFWKVLEDS